MNRFVKMGFLLVMLALFVCCGCLFAAAEDAPENAVASIGEGENITYYETLADAVNDAPAGATVTLFGNATGETIAITKDLTICGTGSYTVTGTTTAAFAVSEGTPHLSLSGDVRIVSDYRIFSVTGGAPTFTVSDAVSLEISTDAAVESTNAILFVEGSAAPTLAVSDNAVLSATGAKVSVLFSLSTGNTTFRVSDNVTIACSYYTIFTENKENKTVPLTVEMSNVKTMTGTYLFVTKNFSDANITIGGGSFTSKEDIFFISNSAKANYTVSGGTFTSGGRFVDKSGDASKLSILVEGATVINCAKNFVFDSGKGTVEVAVHDTVSVTSTATADSSSTWFINLSGSANGTFKTEGTPRFVYPKTHGIVFNGASTANIDINGGTFEGKNSFIYLGGTSTAHIVRVANASVTISNSDTDGNAAVHMLSSCVASVEMSNCQLESVSAFFKRDKTGTSTITVSNSTINASSILHNVYNQTCSATVTLVDVTAITTGYGFKLANAGMTTINITGGSITSPSRVFSCTDKTITEINVQGGELIANKDTSSYILWRSNNGGTGYESTTFNTNGTAITSSGYIAGITAAVLNMHFTGGTVNSVFNTILSSSSTHVECNIIFDGDVTVSAGSQQGKENSAVALLQCGTNHITIKDSATIKTPFTHAFITKKDAALTFEMSGGKVEAASGLLSLGSTVSADEGETYAQKILLSAGEVTVTGGKLVWNYAGGDEVLLRVSDTFRATASSNILATIGTAPSTVEITGGTLESGSNLFSLECDAKFTLCVSGGSSSAKYSIVNCLNTAGAVNIRMTGGTIEAKSGSFYFIGENKKICPSVTFEMSGGTLTSGNHTFQLAPRTDESAPTGPIDTKLTATITGGTLTSKKSAFYAAGVSSHVSVTLADDAMVKTSYWGFNMNDNAIGQFTMTGGKLDCSTTYGITYNGAARAIISISGGEIIANNDAIYLAGTASDTEDLPALVIAGGKIVSTNGSAIQARGEAGSVLHITISGGEVISELHDKGALLQAKPGTVYFTLTGGTLIANYPIRKENGTMYMTMTGGTIAATTAKWQENGANQTRNGSCIFLYGTATLRLSGGTLTDYEDGFAMGINLKSNSVTDIELSEGFTINTKGNCLYNAVADTGISVKLRVTGGTYRSAEGEGFSLMYSKNSSHDVVLSGGDVVTKGFTVHLSGLETDTVSITGGSYISTAAHAALYVRANINNYAASEDNTFNVNVYGGYFEGHALCAARVSYGARLNIYGGVFLYAEDNGGNVLRSGADSQVAHLYVYGGTFVNRSYNTPICYGTQAGKTFLSFTGVYSATGGTSIASDPTVAENGISYPDNVNFFGGGLTLHTGAQVRLVDGSNGLRFVSTIEKSALDYLSSVGATNIRYGTLIAPTSHFDALKVYSKEAFTAAGLSYLDIPAVNGIVENADGSISVRAAIVNIKPENINREFSAIPYIIYELDGQEVVQYGAYAKAYHSRSIANVARLALLDEGRYTQAQREVLATFAPTGEAPVIDLYFVAGQSNAQGCTKFTEQFAIDHPLYQSGYTHILNDGAATGGSAIVSKLVRSFAPTSLGFGSAKDSIGPEIGMADELSVYYNEETNRYACIVKYAHGGTTLRDAFGSADRPEGNWCPPSYFAAGNAKKDERLSGNLYRVFLSQVKDSVGNLRAQGFDVQAKAIYWMQGEADINYPDLYETLLNYLIADMRRDIGNIMGEDLSNLAFIIGGISDSWNVNFSGREAFVATQRRVADQNEAVYFCASNNFATGNTVSDNGHWSTDDAVMIGKMVGNIILNEVLGVDIESPLTRGKKVACVELPNGDTIEYTSLSYALNTAPEGSLVTLLCDLTLYGPLAIHNRNEIFFDGMEHTISSYSIGQGFKFIGCHITVDGLTMDVKLNTMNNYGADLYQNANVTFGADFTLYSYGYGVVANATATIFIDGATIETRAGEAGKNNSAVYIGGSSNASVVTISSATLKTVGYGFCIYANGPAQFTIEGDNTFVTGENCTYLAWVAYAVTIQDDTGLLTEENVIRY